MFFGLYLEFFRKYCPVFHKQYSGDVTITNVLKMESICGDEQAPPKAPSFLHVLSVSFSFSFSFSLSLSFFFFKCPCFGSEGQDPTVLFRFISWPFRIPQKWSGDQLSPKHRQVARSTHVSGLFPLRRYLPREIPFELIHLFCFWFSGAFTSCRTINADSVVMWQHHCDRLLLSLDSCLDSFFLVRRNRRYVIRLLYESWSYWTLKIIFGLLDGQHDASQKEEIIANVEVFWRQSRYSGDYLRWSFI